MPATAKKPPQKDRAGRENVRVKTGLPAPFSPAVCQRMRNIRDRRQACKVKEKDLVASRKALEEQISQSSDGEEQKLLGLKAEHFDVVQELELRRAQIKWLADEMEKTIEQSDQGQLFEDDTDPQPPEDLFSVAAEKATAEAQKAAAGPGEVAEVPGDEYQHLQASVNELDLRDNLKGTLIRHNFTTVGDVAKFLDEEGDLGNALEIGQNAIAEIKKAAKEYRRRHRQAIVKTASK